MKIRSLLLSMVASAAFVAATSTAQATTPTWTPFGFDTQPGLIITLNAGNTATISFTGEPPYDNIEDTYVGVVNNSGHSVSLLSLTANQQIFGFDGDGIDGYGSPGNGTDNTGYGGPNAFFTNIGCGLTCGDVNFINPIADGGFDYFSLEEPLTAANFTGSVTVGGVPEPATWAMLLIGFLGLGYATRRQARSALA